MNNSTTSSLSDIIVSSTSQIIIGAVAILTNGTILCVLLSNVAFMKKSSFVTGMAIGDLLVGLAVSISGAFKIIRIFDGTSSLMVHPSYCMEIFVIPSYLMGNQISSVMFLLCGVERFLAVKYYDWYYMKWSNKIAWYLTGCAYVYCTVSLTSAVSLSLSYDAKYRIPILCTVAAATTSAYTTYTYWISIIGGAIACAGSLTAMVLFTKRKLRVHDAISNVAKNHIKKQWNATRVALCLAVFDLGLVVVPTFLSLVASTAATNSIRSWSLQMLCMRSILNLVVYLSVNSDFRAATLKMLSLQTKVVALLSSVRVPYDVAKRSETNI